MSVIFFREIFNSEVLSGKNLCDFEEQEEEEEGEVDGKVVGLRNERVKIFTSNCIHVLVKTAL